MDISLELYKVFYYVAATLSFSEASKQLYISQSAVSQSIKSLEKKLGHALFIRSTKRVLLTAEGELLLSHIEPAIHLIQKGESLLEGNDSLRGQLRVGASDTICRYFLIPYLQRFHQEYPDVQIRVTNQTSIGCVRLLQDGQVDLVVTNAPNSHLSPAYPAQVIQEFQDVFVANPVAFPLQNHVLAYEDLMNYPILMLGRSTTSEYLYRLFSNHQLKLVPEVELSSNDLLVDLARIGLGIAFVPSYMLRDTTGLFPLRLKEKLPARQLLLAHQELLPPAAQKFLEYFQS
ncbi:MAG: LysR family transcriptional regulator [Blautia sp.]